ncbi:hypothetical protein D3C80_1993130 [compost metagenome]
MCLDGEVVAIHVHIDEGLGPQMLGHLHYAGHLAVGMGVIQSHQMLGAHPQLDLVTDRAAAGIDPGTHGIA